MSTNPQEAPSPAPVQPAPVQYGPMPAKEMQDNSIQPGAPQNYNNVGGQVHPPMEKVQNPQQLVTPLHLLRGQAPQWIDCPFCHQRAQTRSNKEGTPMQILAGAVCCLFCICLTCVPCIAGWCEKTEFRCSNCNQMVAQLDESDSIQVYGPQPPQQQQQPQQPQQQEQVKHAEGPPQYSAADPSMPGSQAPMNQPPHTNEGPLAHQTQPINEVPQTSEVPATK